jgi:hypothetical protein
MSTTFDVLPGNDFIPTFQEVIDLANNRLKKYLSEQGVINEAKIMVQLRKNDENIIVESVLDNQIKWNEDFYAWFYIDGIPGGTDTYFQHFDDLDIEAWNEELKINHKVQTHADTLKQSLDIGHYWKFRRSAGQPGIVCLVYGLIAASVCKLTEGLIYSDDGAWDYKLFPSNAEDFFSWYFMPNLTSNQEYKDWAKVCITSIYDELRNMYKS